MCYTIYYYSQCVLTLVSFGGLLIFLEPLDLKESFKLGEIY